MKRTAKRLPAIMDKNSVQSGIEGLLAASNGIEGWAKEPSNAKNYFTQIGNGWVDSGTVFEMLAARSAADQVLELSPVWTDTCTCGKISEDKVYVCVAVFGIFCDTCEWFVRTTPPEEDEGEDPLNPNK